MPQIIPLDDVPNQSLSILLGGQQTQLNLYSCLDGLHCDVAVNDSPIITGVLCQNENKIVRDAYLGFLGDLCFYDTQGDNWPSSPGLGTRYVFLYLTVADLNGAG